MTSWLEGLGARLPILNAGMGLGIAGSALATAVSEAGGLGVLGLGACPPEVVRREIRALRARSDRAFGVNLILPMLQGGEVDVCLEERVPLLVLFWGDVGPYAAEAARRGVALFAQVGSAAEAVAAAEAGATGVIIQGREAGGHVAATRPLSETLPATRRELGSLPLVAAGGIATGDEIARALAWGADAVSIGTLFLATPEAAVCDAYRARIVAAAAADTVLTKLFDGGWPDAQHRVLRNRLYTDWERAGRPRPGARPGEDRIFASVLRGEERQPLPRYSVVPPIAGFAGDLEEAALYAGMSCEQVTRVEPARAVLARLAAELRAAGTKRAPAPARSDRAGV